MTRAVETRASCAGNHRVIFRRSAIEKAFRAGIKIDRASSFAPILTDFFILPLLFLLPLPLLLPPRLAFFSFSIVFLERKEEGSAGARLSRRRGLKFIDPSYRESGKN